MKKWLILIILMLILVSQSYAWKESFNNGEEIILRNAIQTRGENALCNITIYQDDALVQTANMTQTGLAYSYNAGIAGVNLTENYYVCNIECNLSNTTFLGECNFVVEGKMQIFFLLLFIVAIIIVSGWITHNSIFELFAGIFLVLIGLMFLSGEIIGLSTIYNNGVGIAVSLTGIFFLYTGLFSLLGQRKDKKREEKEEKDNY